MIERAFGFTAISFCKHLKNQRAGRLPDTGAAFEEGETMSRATYPLSFPIP
jgi:hypothetical protein